jgi:hypothetical protein
MRKRQEKKHLMEFLNRAMKSPKKMSHREAKELRKELKNSNYLRRYHDDSSNHGQGLGQADREEN